MTTTWVTRWNDVIAAEPEQPGVWRRKEGGFRVRGRALDPRTGKLRGVNRALADCKRAREAAVELEAELQRIRAGDLRDAPQGAPRFADWAVTVFERKVASGAIESARGRDKWDWCLRVHLIPAFGDVFVDKLTRETVERWKATELLGEHATTKDTKRKRVLKAKRYSPQTANTVLQVLRQVTSEASETFNIADSCRRLDNVDTRRHRTYTYEKPNAIKPADVPKFLGEMRTKFPQHYALVFLGFTTGLRPSSLRPLRATGDHADVKWDEGKLLVRRSHTRRGEVMDATKTRRDQVIALDPEQVSVLRWHVDRLAAENAKRAERSPGLAEAMAKSELLFPAEPNGRTKGGGFRSTSCLDRAFTTVGAAIDLGYPVSPRAMRRTYNDLMREAKVNDVVTRAISGHATESMQRHYSTVTDSEVREGLAAVIDIATGRRRAA